MYLASLELELPLEELPLRSHRDVLADGHRHGAADEGDEAGESHGRLAVVVPGGHAQDQGGVRDQAVLDAEHGRARRPAADVAVVVLESGRVRHLVALSTPLTRASDGHYSQTTAAPEL